VALDEALLIEGQGIADDARAQPVRNLNVMDAPTLAERRAEGVPSTPGALGENLVLEGIDLRPLAAVTHLHLGTEAVLELTRLRTGCAKLQRIAQRKPEEMAGLLGVPAQVVRAGRIQVGDRVEVVQAGPPA
jgi:MOSC domain-containing protein YiiM